ncbi:MAG: hypothetical protein ACTHQE_13155 [Thermomicrobiales bacterium]
MNDRTPAHLSRRRFLIAVAAPGVASIAARAAGSAAPAKGPFAIGLAGRRFIARSRSEPVSSLLTVVREYATTQLATESVAVQFARETAPITDFEAAILDASSAPLADPVGIDGSWQLVVGAAGVRTFHRGIFFAADRFVWTVIASRFEDLPDPPLPRDLARSLHARFLRSHPDGAPCDVDRWRLLPAEDDRDLDGAYRMHESFDREQSRW